MTDIDTAEIRARGAQGWPTSHDVLDLCDALDAARARAEKAENQARHWKEQEEKQRRLRAEEGRWKHRALAAELHASDLPDLRARLAEVEALHDAVVQTYETILAEVEAEVMAAVRSEVQWRERALSAEARLAAVEAVCDEIDAATGGTEFTDRVRAALRGEEAGRGE